MNSHNILLAKTNFRNDEQEFCLKKRDRLSHIYIIGKTGSGKTTLLENLVLQDILNGRGLIYLDPHGDSIEKIFKLLADKQRNNVLYFNIPDNKEQFGYNPIRLLHPDKRPLCEVAWE